jgi:hypothetical protein
MTGMMSGVRNVDEADSSSEAGGLDEQLVS